MSDEVVPVGAWRIREMLVLFFCILVRRHGALATFVFGVMFFTCEAVRCGVDGASEWWGQSFF